MKNLIKLFVQSLVLVVIVLGIIAGIAGFIEWVGLSTFRTVMFFVIGSIITAILLKGEF